MPLNPRSLTIDPGPMAVLTAKANLYSHFKFFVMRCNQYWLDGQWEVIREYSTDSTCGYQVTEPGIYLFAIHMAQDPESPEANAPGGMLTMRLEQADMAVTQTGDDNWITWIEEITDYWILPANCIMMKQGHLRAMQYILKWMYCFHPGPSGTSRQLCITELNSHNCPGHYGAHQNGADIDLNYYTLGPDNKTQCLWPTYPNKIFMGEGLVTDDVDPSKFDISRNWTLWKKIIEVFPQAHLIMDERIRNYMLVNLSAEDALILNSHSTGDSPGFLHHDTHVHISLGGQIAWVSLAM